MKIFLNGEEVKLDSITTIEQLINKYKLDVRKVAVEKNLEIVPQSAFSETAVSEGDNIEIIHFIGGG